MEWLSSLLGLGGGQTSPFGALGGAPGGPPGGSPGPAAAAAPQMMGANLQMPGIWGKLFNQQQPGPPGAPSAAPTATPAAPGGGGGPLGMGTPGGGQVGAMNQAMKLLQPAQIQQPSWMRLLSGPGGGGGM